MSEIPKEAAELLESTIGKYKLEEYLGKGYSGFVFRATCGDIVVAVKVLRKALTDDHEKREKQLERLKRQRDISEQPRAHPNLITILECDVCGSTQRLFVAMTYLPRTEYRPLSELKERIPVAKVRLLLSQIAGAAQWLHEHDFAHRDIKASNILIRHDLSFAVLLDLGVVKNLKFEIPVDVESYAGSDADLVTLRCSPIELLSKTVFEGVRKNYEWRALSIYQLGILIYVMLTGEEPFARLGHTDVVDAVRAGMANALPKADISVDEKDHALITLMLNATDTDWTKRIAVVKWEDFNFVQLEPTIVVLFAGGTIGTSEAHNERSLVSSAESLSELFSNYEHRIKADYRQIYEPTSPFPFKIKWESLAADELILSENATPEYWNALMRKLKSIVEIYASSVTDSGLGDGRIRNNRYLAGIIVLHGTDTLAYTAAALTFGMRNLPCPIILTGSNQPPNENHAEERRLFTSRSDVWRNLRHSVHFIRTLGHRYTEVFVVFNATVFHGPNLKKVPLRDAQEVGETVANAINEPYTYHSVYLPRRYMFKWVDGFLCNNFYPIYDNPYATFLSGKLHARKSPHSAGLGLQIQEYSSARVELVMTSPVSNYRGVQMHDKAIILLVGYDSGTFPSIEAHHLAHSLRTWAAKKKSIFILTEFGLFPAHISYNLSSFLKDADLNPIPVYGLIKETAVPLLLHLFSRVEAEGKTTDIISGMRDIVDSDSWKNSMPGMILGNPFDHENRRNALGDHMRKVVDEFSRDEEKLFSVFQTKLKRHFDSKETRQGLSSAPAVNSGVGLSVSLPPELTLWFILRKCQQAFTLGYGPTVFKELTDMGVKFGGAFFKHILGDVGLKDKERWTGLLPEQRDVTKLRVRKCVDEFCERLWSLGLVRALPEFDIEPYAGRYRLRLGVSSTQGPSLEASGVYAAKQFDDEEAKFFSSLQDGTPYGVPDVEYYRTIERQLVKLGDETWEDPKIQAIGWLILGMFKGLMIEALFALKFDDWVKHINGLKSVSEIDRLLRPSIQTEITASSSENFSFSMTYVSREPDYE